MPSGPSPFKFSFHTCHLSEEWTSFLKGLLPHYENMTGCIGVKSRSVLHLRTNSESSETSDIPYSFTPILFQSLIFLSPLFRFRSSLLILSVRPFPIFYAIVNYVDSTSCPCDRSSPRTPYLLLLPNSDTRSCSAPWLRTPPVFKPAVSIDTTQSDYCVSSAFNCISFPPTNSLSPDFCPTPVSDLLRNYRTYRWLYEWAQHISWSQVLPVTFSCIFR